MQTKFRALAPSALRWIPRIALAIIAFSLIAPALPRAVLGDPQTVETQHPQLCVHTRLIDEVDEWKIQRSLQMVREMGADTIVEFFPWAYIETSEGQYNWANVDRIVRHAENQGIQIIARMGFVPAWAQPEADERTTLNTLPEDRFDEFADFVAAFASRYAGIIDRLIIWNEPNLAFEWGYREVSPEGYARLLAAVYPAAHAANPNVEILAAPLAPNLEPPGSATAMNDLDYLQALYDAGAAANFDALAMHTYGFTQPANDAPAPDRLNYRRAELLREIMVENDDGDKPVYITEMGWNDSERWAYAVSPSDRIAYTLQAYETAADWDWAEKVCNWVLRYPYPTYSYPDRFTLLDTEFQPHPLYNALQAYSRGINIGEALWYPPPAAR
ncbi:MAG: hypothetical protein UZ15_CFX003003367 [Chloroflexi bacterium OLB15]|nr:MAG: hypothetical protein UZ15_CFX003003367 [Chloroflexi bacterium OLB15]